MVKRLSLERLDRIVEAGLAHFLRKGYRGARIDEIAEHAGVSAGSIYNYCTCKEALFDLCLSRGLGHSELPVELPHSMHPSVSVIDRALDRLQSSSRFQVWASVYGGTASGTWTIDEIAESLYDWIDANGRGIRLIERCAGDWPELARYFYDSFRGRGLAGFAALIETETKNGGVARPGPADITARVIVELCAYFAMHRRKDPQDLSDQEDEVRATVLHFIRLALRPTAQSDAQRTGHKEEV